MEHTYDSLFIGGDWVAPSSAATITVASATTEEPIGRVPEAVSADVDAAVAAARSAFDDPTGWATWEPGRRAEAMERLADMLGKRGEQFAQLVSRENGMPIVTSRRSEAVIGAAVLRYYAALARQTGVEESRPAVAGNGTTVVRRTPVGVVAAIVPWNFPQTLTMFKLGPALAAGCTIVLKPARETALDAFLLAEAVREAGLPPGVVNVVPADREASGYLVGHPGVDKVAFTGSTATGRAIAEQCGRLLRPVTLELGGKSAAIVLDDADLEPNLDAFFRATLNNNGQTCLIGTRVLAPRSRYGEVVARCPTARPSCRVRARTGSTARRTNRLGRGRSTCRRMPPPVPTRPTRRRTTDQMPEPAHSDAGGPRPPVPTVRKGRRCRADRWV
ncbi:aldehyde dehydrogenase family protein [Streptomyces sp. NPDC050121]|uniref:aldehyde dehydrogenase family protein n=1 Tax=Streptomyces sp. NPDC050121 TaxID=3365601 RepID=UPI0037925156